MSLFDRDKSAGRTPVSLITGFLGSGKTTVLNHLLRHPGMADSAVIVNEFGEIGLDHLLIEAVSGEVAVMANGCICCTVRSDLADTLRRLLAQRDAGEVPAFSRVLIESTGLADPAPIVQMLLNNPLVSHFARLDAVVTTVDAVNAPRQLAEHEEAVKQVALADRVLLTKTDLADGAALRGRLAALNPAAPLIEVRHGAVAPDQLFGAALFDPARKTPDVRRWLNEDAYRERAPGHHAPGHPARARHAPSDGGHDHDGHDHEGHSHDAHGHGGPAPANSDAQPVDGGVSAEAGDAAHDHHGSHAVTACCLTFGTPLAWESVSAWLAALRQHRGADLLRVKGILNLRDEAGPVVIHGVHHVFHPPVALDRWPDTDRRSRIVVIARNIARGELTESAAGFGVGA